MTSEVFTNYTTEALSKRIKLSTLALYTVWVGGTMGIVEELNPLLLLFP